MDLITLKRIVNIEYSEIVKYSDVSDGKLRIYLVDSSFIDIWFSKKIEGRYSFHWERQHIDGKIF